MTKDALPDVDSRALGRQRRRWGRWLLVIGLVLLLVPVVTGSMPMLVNGPSRQQFPATAGVPTAPPSVIVASFNMAHGRGERGHQIFTSRSTQERHLATSADLLRSHNVDVVLLQEADGGSWWASGVDHVQDVADRLQWAAGPRNSQVRGFGLDYGNAIISRFALGEGQAINWRGGFSAPPKGAVAARMDLDGQALTLVSLHLDPLDAERRRRQARDLVLWLQGLEGELLLGGDFNADWNKANDAVRILAEELHLQPWPGAETSPPTFRSGSRLDWMLVSSGLRISEPQMIPAPSDHLMVVVTVESRGGSP